MLETARAKRAEGTDVVVGVVETHGRAETAALLEGLEAIPKGPSTIAASASTSSISTRRSPAIPRSCCSTTSPIPTHQAPFTQPLQQNIRSHIDQLDLVGSFEHGVRHCFADL